MNPIFFVRDFESYIVLKKEAKYLSNCQLNMMALLTIFNVKSLKTGSHLSVLLKQCECQNTFSLKLISIFKLSVKMRQFFQKQGFKNQFCNKIKARKP